MTPLTINVLLDPQDMARFGQYLEGMSKRMQREDIGPILLECLEPIVAREKAILDPHSKSGALEMSITARMGAGDKPGTVSAFSAASTSSSQIATAWGTGRAQQRRWSVSMGKRRGRRRSVIFYADWAEGGHRIVTKNSAGQKRTKPNPQGGESWSQPIHFARDAMDELGDIQAEKAAKMILDHISPG